MNALPHYENLFFVKRRPKLKLLRNRNWINPLPDKPAEWDKELISHGFMPSSVGTAGSTEPVPAAIVADIEELNKSALLTTFFRLSHRAKYHQNQFYMYQWVFVFGAFLTTFFGGFTVLTSTQAAAQQADYTAQNALATSQITATLDTTVTQAAIAKSGSNCQ